MKINRIGLSLLAVAVLASCSSKRDTLSYFKDIDTESFSADINLNTIEPIIQPLDELNISVSSILPEMSAPYNLPLENPSSSSNGFIALGSPHQATYFVSKDGYITMPVLGKVHVAGMTTDEVANYLTEQISKEIEEPVVIVTLLNFNINVAGEVANPGKYRVTDKRFSILDALSTAGDLTPYGERTNVLLIREENGKRVSHLLDLTSADLLTSPYFYLKQNDYIYVAPNDIRKDNAKYNQNNSYKLSVISTVVSAASVVASLVIALTIRK